MSIWGEIGDEFFKTSQFLNFVYKDSGLLGQKMSIKDLIFWLTQLSTYIKAGITLNEAVKILFKYFFVVIGALIKQIS